MKSFPRLPFHRNGLEGLQDTELAEALGAGSHDALTVIVNRYTGVVYRISREILDDDGEAEEVVQQVFLEVFRNIGQFDPTRGSFKSWLVKRASSRAVDRVRQLRSQGVYGWTRMPAVVPTTAMEGLLGMSRQELVRFVEQLLAMLNERQQAVLRMRFYRGLTIKEIQDQTKQTIPTVKHLLYDGINTMRTAFSSDASQKPERRGDDNVPSSPLL